MKRLLAKFGVMFAAIAMALGLTAGAATASVTGPFTTAHGCRFYTSASIQYSNGYYWMVGSVAPSPFTNCLAGQVKMHYLDINNNWRTTSIPYTSFNGQAIASVSVYPVNVFAPFNSEYVDTNAQDSQGSFLGNRHLCGAAACN